MIRLLLLLVPVLFACGKAQPCNTTEYYGRVWVERGSADTIFQLGETYSLIVDTFLVRNNDRFVDLTGSEEIAYDFIVKIWLDEKWVALAADQIQLQAVVGRLASNANSYNNPIYYSVVPEISGNKMRSNVSFKFPVAGKYLIQFSPFEGKVLIPNTCNLTVEYYAAFVPTLSELLQQIRHTMLTVEP